MRGSFAYIQGVAYMGAICKAGVNPAICVTSFQGMVRTGLIKTQALVRWRLAKNAVQLKLTNCVL